MSDGRPKLYTELAGWWQLVSPTEDYADEAAFFKELFEAQNVRTELEHVEGDMRALRLGRLFDGVLIHDAIMYMTSEEDLRAALVTAHEHCGPGGVLVVVPDWVSETFRPHTTQEGTDAGGRGVRYMEWV